LVWGPERAHDREEGDLVSTAPTGWQAPKTNWAVPDAVSSGDLNRAEGNSNATETGNRTLDPTQAPASSTGTLRQIIDWFANRIKAITGTTNWWDAPATTLAQALPASQKGAANGLAELNAQSRVPRDITGLAAGVWDGGTPGAATWVLMRVSGSVLQFSTDNGATWQTTLTNSDVAFGPLYAYRNLGGAL